MNHYAVIMAGGSGTRLWPMSRKSKPKQLQNLVSTKSLVVETFDRINRVIDEKNIFISTVPEYADEIRKQLPQIPHDNYIIEPALRNTAAAQGLIDLFIKNRDSEGIVATFPSDHVVNDVDAFVETLKIAYKAVEKYPDNLVLVGVNPTKPDTGLGYIKMGSEKDKIGGQRIFKVEKFVEKPDLATAEKYLQSWEYLWSPAYYFFRAGEFLSLMKEMRPDSYKSMQEIEKLLPTMDDLESKNGFKKAYEKIKEEQIANIIEEHGFEKVLVIPADLGWSDIGSWGTLHEVLSGNYDSTMVSRGYHIDIGSDNCLVYGDKKLIATLGLKDVVVIDTDDVMLIADKNNAQDIKKLLEKLKSEGKHLYL